MNKVYCVVELGGMYEDKWEHIIAVCGSKEVAERLRKENDEHHNIKCDISLDEYDKLNEQFIINTTYNNFTDWAINNTDYTKEQILAAEEKYDPFECYCDTIIKEVDFYGN